LALRLGCLKARWLRVEVRNEGSYFTHWIT